MLYYFTRIFTFNNLLQVLLVFLVSCFSSALCDVQPSHLPRELRACLTQHTDDDPDATDEEVTISCMLEFMWLNRKECEVASPETVNWLSSLVNRSIEQTVTEFKDDVRTFQGLDELKLTKNTGSRTDSTEQSPALLLERLMNGGSPRRRKEYRMLSDEERSRYHAAINAMKNDQVNMKAFLMFLNTLFLHLFYQKNGMNCMFAYLNNIC